MQGKQARSGRNGFVGGFNKFFRIGNMRERRDARLEEPGDGFSLAKG